MNTDDPQPCEFLPVLQCNINVMKQELESVGGFRPSYVQAWEEFMTVFRPHLHRCPHCTQAIDEFVDFIYAHPLPKRKSFIREWTENLVIGTLFNLFAPPLYRQTRDWLNGDHR